MENKKYILEIIRNCIVREGESVLKLKDRVSEDVATVVDCILHSKGRVVVTGIGKSANIGLKIVSTLNSTGTPAIFMHAADAIHGDLGIVQKEDLVVCISKSGQTPEIKVLVPILKNFGNTLVALCGNKDSFLVREADYFIDATVSEEACPNNLAPTSSTTAQLVMGDALAIALLTMRGFTAGDFAKYHPGGALGKQLYLRVKDLACQNECPKVDVEADIQHVIIEITSKCLGATAVMQDEKLVGIITDGDIRRMLLRQGLNASLKARDIMGTHPKWVYEDEMAVDALSVMRSNSITQLLVLDRKDRYVGVIHLHDLLKEGII